jgi:hypothetical protein
VLRALSVGGKFDTLVHRPVMKRGDVMSFKSPADGFRLPDSYMRPPLMAIGDSLYNGMRSATINGEYAAKSIPALTAEALAPDYQFR